MTHPKPISNAYECNRCRCIFPSDEAEPFCTSCRDGESRPFGKKEREESFEIPTCPIILRQVEEAWEVGKRERQATIEQTRGKPSKQ